MATKLRAQGMSVRYGERQLTVSVCGNGPYISGASIEAVKEAIKAAAHDGLRVFPRRNIKVFGEYKSYKGEPVLALRFVIENVDEQLGGRMAQNLAEREFPDLMVDHPRELSDVPDVLCTMKNRIVFDPAQPFQLGQLDLWLQQLKSQLGGMFVEFVLWHGYPSLESGPCEGFQAAAGSLWKPRFGSDAIAQGEVQYAEHRIVHDTVTADPVGTMFTISYSRDYAISSLNDVAKQHNFKLIEQVAPGTLQAFTTAVQPAISAKQLVVMARSVGLFLKPEVHVRLDEDSVILHTPRPL